MVHVPVVRRKPWGIICLLMNVFVPGTGTMMAASNQEVPRYFLFGLIQLLTFWTVISYVWSVVMGVLIFVKSE
ncbi:MAG: hypothetical protein ACPHID_00345 [Thermoplasmatota archaeon]